MTAFVIVSMARSGTQLLTSLLNQHPDVTAFGELFNPPDVEDLDDAAVVEKVLSTPGVAGLTVLQYQLAHRPLTFAALLAAPMRVIVLERQDQLARIRSAAQATQTRRWGCHVRQDPPQVWLHPEDTRQRLLLAASYYRQLRRQKTANLMLWVYYEELVADQDTVMDRVWQFLDVKSPGHVRAETFQQENRPLSETVTNLEQVLDQVKRGAPPPVDDHEEKLSRVQQFRRTLANYRELIR